MDLEGTSRKLVSFAYLVITRRTWPPGNVAVSLGSGDACREAVVRLPIEPLEISCARRPPRRLLGYGLQTLLRASCGQLLLENWPCMATHLQGADVAHICAGFK